MVDIPTNKKEVAKLIFKTAKEAFRRGYRAYKTSKKQHDSYKGKIKQRGDASEGVVPYSKENIKKAIRSTKFQGRAAKLAKKQKKPAGSRARTISFVGKGYQGDKTKTMQVPMASKVQMRKIRKEIGESVKKFMKERVGRKARGGLSLRKKKKREEESYFKFREEIEKRRKRRQWRKEMEQDLEHHKQHKKGVWVNKGGEIKITPKLKHTWNKGPGKSHRHSTYGGTIGFKKGKFSVEGTWKKDKGKVRDQDLVLPGGGNEFSYESKPSKSIILRMAFAKGGLLRKPKLAKRGF